MAKQSSGSNAKTYLRRELRVSPSLFQFKEEELAEAVQQVVDADIIHIDVTDGAFVNQKKPSLFYDTSKLKVVLDNARPRLDVHLMVVNPLEDIERYATLAPTPRFISFHVESKSDPETVIKKIREYGIKPAIALNPATPLSDISGLLDKVDMVLLMSVVPGLPGQGYIESVTDKIAELRGMIFEQGLDTLIEVDGGIKLHNVKYPINAGADVIVSGTGVFSDAGRTPTNVIEEMKRMKRNEKLAVASDHGGCALKKQLLEYFDKKGIEYHDFGCPDEKSVDYPVYADYVAKAVQKHEYSRGILVCGTGIGISIRANRYPGIRATLCYNKFTAEMSRKHNNSNVLVMGGRTTSPAKAKTIFNTWYTTEYEGGRHQKRVAMLDAPLK